MKPQITLILIAALVGAAAARTIVIDTDPPGAEIWQNGEKLGKAPLVYYGPIEEPLTLTIVKIGYDSVTQVIEIPDDGEDHIYVLNAMESSKSVFLSIIAGFGAGLLSVVLLLVAAGF